MTMPHLMNCSHSCDGWCLACVGELQKELVKRLELSLDIETLRPYHDSSFMDPPSYHEPEAKDLWDCDMCVERYIERAKAILAELRP